MLYLFAGRKRRADVKHFRAKHAKPYNIELVMIELDILRSRKHDLSMMQRKAYYLKKARAGGYHSILTSPPCGTFSRARWANNAGPKPLRLRNCPRGFPWLTGPQKQSVELHNSFVDFSANMLEAHLNQSPDAMGTMEHPEDLGAVRTGAHPGSAC